MTSFLLAGGGTAGHVNPMLALAEFIRGCERDACLTLLGTSSGLEARLVPERGFELTTIAKLPFPRGLSLAAFRFPARFLRLVWFLRRLYRERGVDVVVGFGGYTAAPAYIAARLERVPFVLHEANAKPGLANRLGSFLGAGVAVAFAGTGLRGEVVTGMPLRRELVDVARVMRGRSVGERGEAAARARRFFGLDPSRPTLLVTGGSLGARVLNEVFVGCAESVVAAGVQVLHVWGGLTELRDPGVAGYRVLKYCDRMELALQAASLTVSRAGSTIVSELAALGVPAVLVPYEVGNGEQSLNARVLCEAGGAVVLRESELSLRRVVAEVVPLVLDSGRLLEMGAAAFRVGVCDGTERLYRLVGDALGGGCRSGGEALGGDGRGLAGSVDGKSSGVSE